MTLKKQLTKASDSGFSSSRHWQFDPTRVPCCLSDATMQEKGHHWIPMLNLSTLLSMNKHSGDRIYPWRWKGGLLPARQHHLLVGGKELRCKATPRVKHFNFCTTEGWQTSKFNFCKVQKVSDQSQTRKRWTVGHSWLPFHFWKHCRLSRGSAQPLPCGGSSLSHC